MAPQQLSERFDIRVEVSNGSSRTGKEPLACRGNLGIACFSKTRENCPYAQGNK